MDVGNKPYRKSYLWVAIAVALASTSVLERVAQADPFQWYSKIAQAAAGVTVTQAVGACCSPAAPHECSNGISRANCTTAGDYYAGDGSTCGATTDCDRCDDPICVYCWTGTSKENNCPLSWNGDDVCDCGCQFVDSDCPETQPEAIFTLTPEQPVIGVAFRVDASQSYDRPSAGPITKYSWKWGDNTPDTTGVSVQHTYALAGRFTITLTVSDSATPPNTDTATKTVTIAATVPPTGGINHAPTASLVISPAQGSINDEFTFDASGSKDADSDPLAYRFNFGDGNETEFVSEKIVTHEYDKAGSYVVRLTVRDDQNASVDITSSVSVLGLDGGNSPPVALIGTGPRTGSAPVTLNFDGRISYDPDGDPLIYEWTVTLGELAYDVQTGSVVNQLFDQPGSYSVVLKVTDIEGASSSSNAETVTVTEAGTPVEPPPPAPIPEPEPPPPSYTQRPPSRTCGIGILMPMLACLMGLVGRRRFGRSRD